MKNCYAKSFDLEYILKIPFKQQSKKKTKNDSYVQIIQTCSKWHNRTWLNHIFLKKNIFFFFLTPGETIRCTIMYEHDIPTPYHNNVQNTHSWRRLRTAWPASFSWNRLVPGSTAFWSCWGTTISSWPRRPSAGRECAGRRRTGPTLYWVAGQRWPTGCERPPAGPWRSTSTVGSRAFRRGRLCRRLRRSQGGLYDNMLYVTYIRVVYTRSGSVRVSGARRLRLDQCVFGENVSVRPDDLYRPIRFDVVQCHGRGCVFILIYRVRRRRRRQRLRPPHLAVT